MQARRRIMRRRIGASVAALAIVAGGAVAMRPAGAAAQALSLGLQSGELSVGDQSFVLPTTAGFEGTLDDETGELRGSFTFPLIISNITEPFPVVVEAQLSQSGDAVGSVDLATGAATLDATISIGLTIKTAAGATLVGGACSIGPISLEFTGSWDATTGTLSISDDGFSLPNSSGCASPGIDFGPIIDDLLGGGDTSAVLVLGTGTATTAPSSTTPTTGGPTTPTSRPVTTPPPTVPTGPTGPAPSVNQPRPATNGTQNVQPVIVDQEAGAAEEFLGDAQVTG
jgi:hypothetical protein